jgi:hypothetical protein
MQVKQPVVTKLLVPLSPLPHAAIRDADDLGQYLQRGENVTKALFNAERTQLGAATQTLLIGRQLPMFFLRQEPDEQEDEEEDESDGEEDDDENDEDEDGYSE